MSRDCFGRLKCFIRMYDIIIPDIFKYMITFCYGDKYSTVNSILRKVLFVAPFYNYYTWNINDAHKAFTAFEVHWLLLRTFPTHRLLERNISVADYTVFSNPFNY